MISTSPDRGRLILGGGLVLLGALFLVGQLFDVRIGERTWPLFIIIPGLGLLGLGLVGGGPGAVALSIAGGITTMAGLVLAYQELTDQWATWAYAWALVAPGGVALGMLLAGLVQRDRELVENGWRLCLVGVGLFVGFGLFFEGLIGLTPGYGPFGGALVPAALVVLGVLVAAWGILGRRRPT